MIGGVENLFFFTNCPNQFVTRLPAPGQARSAPTPGRRVTNRFSCGNKVHRCDAIGLRLLAWDTGDLPQEGR